MKEHTDNVRKIKYRVAVTCAAEKAQRWLIDALFPRRCPVCDRIVEPKGEMICSTCRKEIAFIEEPVCKVCGRQLSSEEQERCHHCERHHFRFEYAISLMNYNETAARSLAAVKYRHRREYLAYYAMETAERLGPKFLRMRLDALIPVPVHEERLRERGYNQAEVLAEEIGKRLGIPVYAAALGRRKNTKALKELNAGQRLKNLTAAFYSGYIPPDVRNVCIVDDIFTTGATMEACTRLLLEAGVERVYCFSLSIRTDI